MEFSIVILIPKDINLPFNTEKFILKATNKGSQNVTLVGLLPTRIPKNLKGRDATEQFRKAEALAKKISSTYTPFILLFIKFTLNPKTISKDTSTSTALMPYKFSQEASPQITKSSTYSNKEKQISFNTHKPLNLPSSTTLFIKPFKALVTMIKRKGVKGSLALAPIFPKTPSSGYYLPRQTYGSCKQHTLSTFSISKQILDEPSYYGFSWVWVYLSPKPTQLY